MNSQVKRKGRSTSSVALLAALLILSSGCEEESQQAVQERGPVAGTDESTTPTPSAASANSQAANDPDAGQPPVIVNSPPPAAIVEVKLAERDAATCLIKQGEQFPAAALSNSSGEATELRATFGASASVVLFWSADESYSVKWLEDLLFETVGKQPGVNVTAINTSADTQAAEELLATKLNDASLADPQGFAALHDADKALYSQVSTGPLPRLFLIDADGKVLWFCIDYSNASYDELQSALRFVAAGSGTE